MINLIKNWFATLFQKKQPHRNYVHFVVDATNVEKFTVTTTGGGGGGGTNSQLDYDGVIDGRTEVKIQ